MAGFNTISLKLKEMYQVCLPCDNLSLSIYLSLSPSLYYTHKLVFPLIDSGVNTLELWLFSYTVNLI